MTTADTRQEIEAVVNTFRQWLLESADAQAELVADVDEAAGVDDSMHRLFTEWIGLRTVLDEDARANRDQVQQALTTFQEQTHGSQGALESAMSALKDSSTRVEQSVMNMLTPLVRDRDHLRDTMRSRLQIQQLNWLELILDLRDAFEQGSIATRQVVGKARWRRPFMNKSLSEGLTAGYDLALSRIDAALASRDVKTIDCVGRPVDPEQMKVVETIETTEVAAGQVAEIVREGYRCGDEIVRLAEVKVAAS